VRRWPRPAQLLVKAVLSVVVIVGYPMLGVNLAEGVWDTVTLDGCVKGYAQIQADYKIATDHAPDTTDVKVAAGYIVETEKVLEQRAAALTCPRSVQDEQERFVKARRSYWIFLSLVALHGIPQDPFAFSLWEQQYGNLNGRAGQAAQELTAAIEAEYERQHPPQQLAAQ
jgi:hypothetical protein